MSTGFTDAQLAAFLSGTLEDEALIDVIEAGVPALDAAEQAAWNEMRAALVGLVERNRFV